MSANNTFKISRIIYKIKKHKFNSIYWLTYHLIFQSIKTFNSFNYLLFKTLNSGKLCVTIDGHNMYLNPNDSGISKDLILNPNREELSQFMLNEVGEDDSVIDLGANIGYYALKEARIVKGKGTICVIEPVRENVYWLRKNLCANGYSDVKVYQLAIGDEDKETEINISESSNLHSLVNKSSNKTKKEKIKLMKLDSFISENGIEPTFIRMDVEGYEYEILQGAKDTLNRSVNLKLMVEIHPLFLGREKFRKFLKILKNNDFEAKYVVFDNVLFYPHVKTGSFLYEILLYLHSKFSSVSKMTMAAHKDMTIADLIGNERIVSGEFGCPHVFFEKKH